MVQGPNNIFRGLYRGYYVILSITAEGYHITVNATKGESEPLETPNAFLSRLQQQNKNIGSASATDHALKLTILPFVGWRKTIPDIVNPVIDQMIEYLIREQFVTGCETCGNRNELKLYNINQEYRYLCSACGESAEVALENNREELLAKKSNPITGLVGAFLGALLGIIVWIVIYKLGYIAGIAGAVIAICAMKGYAKLGGHLDTKGVLLSVIVFIVGIYLAHNLSWALDIYTESRKEFKVSFFDAYRSIPQFRKLSTELNNMYWRDLVLGYFLSLVSSATLIFQAFRESRGAYKIKKLEK